MKNLCCACSAQTANASWSINPDLCDTCFEQAFSECFDLLDYED
jgi:hypothetical protein